VVLASNSAATWLSILVQGLEDGHGLGGAAPSARCFSQRPDSNKQNRASGDFDEVVSILSVKKNSSLSQPFEHCHIKATLNFWTNVPTFSLEILAGPTSATATLRLQLMPKLLYDVGRTQESLSSCTTPQCSVATIVPSAVRSTSDCNREV
jgi:hypothetical protein